MAFQAIPAAELPAYLTQRGLLDNPQQATEVRELSGGFANHVHWVERAHDFPIVVKQGDEGQRVDRGFYTPIIRIQKEFEALELLRKQLDPAELPLPEPLNFDPEQHVIVFRAFTESHLWLHDVLAGQFAPDIHLEFARQLATLHTATAGLASQHPYDNEAHYESCMQVQAVDVSSDPDLCTQFRALLDRGKQAQLCLIHGDVDHKNVLITPAGPRMIDFDTSIYGTPSQDLGYVLAHSLLAALCAAARPGFDLFAARTQDFLGRYFALAPHFDLDPIRQDVVDFTWAFVLGRIDGLARYAPMNDHPEQASRLRQLATQSAFTQQTLDDWFGAVEPLWDRA